ncbi:hypothetical protein BO71DRAFT_436282 [Aspergillus ellipticus CBS 707.79]|uniref:Uncharacterized protein n=1 Tax=Aspergillus ellipticus CBS 707.79 TaxID=1448320 RepID=A0A319CT38_9EURO|nr:hypothetical protein BO71DRAFT_436282 [Aspergillus ellipticus CBS 707.79]
MSPFIVVLCACVFTLVIRMQPSLFRLCAFCTGDRRSNPEALDNRIALSKPTLPDRQTKVRYPKLGWDLVIPNIPLFLTINGMIEFRLRLIDLICTHYVNKNVLADDNLYWITQKLLRLSWWTQSVAGAGALKLAGARLFAASINRGWC